MNPEARTPEKCYWWLWISPLFTIPTVLYIFVSTNLSIERFVCGQAWGGNACYDLSAKLGAVVAMLGAALWHLILLVPALNRQSAFVRWHGRQALLLAAVRTAVPVGFLLYARFYALGWLWAIPVLMAVWFFGTMWGHWQARRGDCALMRWTGHGAGLPLATQPATPGAGMPPPGGSAIVAAAPAPVSSMRERPEHMSLYDRGVVLRAQGRPQEAAPFFYKLLLSDCTPELKARVAQELNQMRTQMGMIDERVTPDVLVAIVRFSRDRDQQRTALGALNLLGLVEAL